MQNNNNGYIDFFDGHKIVGWVLPIDGENPAKIDVFIEGICVAKDVYANQMRADVRDAGFGSGNHGFEIKLQDGLLEERNGLYTIEIRRSACADIIISQVFDINIKYEHANTDKENSNDDGNVGSGFNIGFSRSTKNKIYKLRIEKIDASTIRGWSIDQESPESTYDIEIIIDGCHFCYTQNNRPRADLLKKGISTGLGGIYVELPLKKMEAGDHIVTIRLPNGFEQDTNIKIPTSQLFPKMEIEQAYEAPLCVIVPVYNAYEDLKICISRLKYFTPKNVEILFINDASTDERIKELLEIDASDTNMRILNNIENIGFTRTVNRGIFNSGHADVIFLNSDARVTPGWTIGLRTAAYSAPRIATVTAMSDRAGAFSAPNIGNENILPYGVGEIEYARAFRRNSLGLYPRVPTGNGFCMYVRRACINEIGPLDEECFPRGYGEENDFCMRAFRAGWHNIIDDRTYVYHERTKSFGNEKDSLISAGRIIIDKRYPEYKQAISAFTKDPIIQLARFRARQALENCRSGKSNEFRILYVISTKTGGTPQTNKDLMDALEDTIESWTLRCDSKSIELCRLQNGVSEVIQHHILNEPVDPLTHRSNEYDSIVSEWILSYNFDIVHIRHIGWHSITLPMLIKRQEIKLIFSFHDYYMLSPTVKMLDDSGVYLGSDFTPEGRTSRQSLWPRGVQPDPVGPWLEFWRARGIQALRHCDAFITTSESARDLILAHMPEIPSDEFVVIPHGRDFDSFFSLRQPLNQYGTPLRILVPGNIDVAKGLNIIYALIEHDRAGIIEFHILGDMNMIGRKQHPRIIQHGKYTRDDFASRVEKIRPHIGAVFSIWNETYCHTLTEMWSVGIPVAVFDMPTVAARVRASGAGWVLDHTNIPHLYESLLDLSFSRDQQKMTNNAIIDWQTGYGVANTTRVMAASYLDVYRSVNNEQSILSASRAVIRIGVVCPSERDLRNAPPSTFIRIWERTRNNLDRKITYIRMTPETLLANIRSNSINGAILLQSAIPRTMVYTLLESFLNSKIPYLLDIDQNMFDARNDNDQDEVDVDYAPFLNELADRANIITVATPALLETVKSINSRVELLPNWLSDRLWRRTPAPRQEDEFIRALYMGNPIHRPDLDMILPSLDVVAAENSRFRLTVIGPSIEDLLTPGRRHWLESIDIPSDKKSYDKFVPWIQSKVGIIDFALAPMRDIEGNITRSPIKILDYSALGLPVVVSDISIHRQIAHLIPKAVLANNNFESWRDAINAMIDKDRRTNEVTNDIRSWVFQNALMSSHVDEFDTLVKAMIENVIT